MSDLNDLLSAARNLNDPTTGVTPGWKKQLNTSTDKDVTARLGILESLDTALNTELVPTPSDVNELVILVEGYLQMTKGLYTFLLKFGNADKKTEKSVRDALKNLANEVQKVKLSILQEPSSSNLFLDTMVILIGKPIVIGEVNFPLVTQGDFTLTKELFKHGRFSLRDSKIKNLTDSWDTVVASFANDAKVGTLDNPTTKPDAEAGFLLMHSLLEILYERLETNVTRIDEDILSPSI